MLWLTFQSETKSKPLMRQKNMISKAAFVVGASRKCLAGDSPKLISSKPIKFVGCKSDSPIKIQEASPDIITGITIKRQTEFSSFRHFESKLRHWKRFLNNEFRRQKRRNYHGKFELFCCWEVFRALRLQSIDHDGKDLCCFTFTFETFWNWFSVPFVRIFKFNRSQQASYSLKIKEGTLFYL